MCLHIDVVKRILCAACVVGGIFHAAEAYANDTDEPTRIATPEVVVSATRTEKEVFEVPVSAAVVGQKEMKREPQKTIAELLRDIPGVEVSDGRTGGSSKQVRIRGESGSRVLVLIDGMKSSEQKSMNGSMILIDPSNVERIEVIKGPSSVLYGSEAIGGVVNIITKKGGTKPVQGSITTTFDSSVDSFTPTAAIYGLYNGFGYRVSGGYTDAHDKKGAKGTIANTSYWQNNYSAYLDYTWENAKVGFGYDQFSSRIHNPGATSGAAFVQSDLPKWDRERMYAFAELNNISEYLQKLKLVGFTQRTEKVFTNQIDVHTSFYRRGTLMTVDADVALETTNKQRSYGLNLQSDWTLGDSHYVIAGVDYLRDNLDATETQEAFSSIKIGSRLPRVSPDPENGKYTNKGYQETVALFIQDEWNFANDWSATFGLRQTWVQSSLDETNNPKLSTSSDADAHLVGSVGLVYSGFDDWRLRASYAQGYKYPQLQQMYIGTKHGNDDFIRPNENLKPETSQSFEVGARYQSGGLSADGALFYTLAEDYIYRASKTTNGKRTYQFDNGNSSRTYGAELEVAYLIEPWNITPYLSGTYLYKKIDRGAENGGQTALTDTPRFSGRAGARFEHDLSSSVSLHADAFARMACRGKEEFGKGNVEKTAGWTTANFAVGTEFGEEKQYFVDVNFNNIFNRAYTPAASTNEDPGFHTVIRMGMEF